MGALNARNGGRRRGISAPQLTGAFGRLPGSLAPTGSSLALGWGAYSSRSSLCRYCIIISRPRQPPGGKKTGVFPLCLDVFIPFNIFHNILYLAIQNLTKYLYCVSADTLVPFEPGNLGWANSVFLYQGILGNSSSSHGLPQSVV